MARPAGSPRVAPSSGPDDRQDSSDVVEDVRSGRVVHSRAYLLQANDRLVRRRRLLVVGWLSVQSVWVAKFSECSRPISARSGCRRSAPWGRGSPQLPWSARGRSARLARPGFVPPQPRRAPAGLGASSLRFSRGSSAGSPIQIASGIPVYSSTTSSGSRSGHRRSTGNRCIFKVCGIPVQSVPVAGWACLGDLGSLSSHGLFHRVAV